MRICYVQEENQMWGGVKIVFEQAEALQERGHEVVIVSKDRPPDWYDVQVPLLQVESFTSATIPDCDFAIGTFWTAVKAVLPIKKAQPVHLCQGYEGDISYYASLRQEIETLYRMPILTLSIHEPLTQLLWDRFRKRAITVGQGINRRVFQPARNPPENTPKRVLLVGPFEVDLKGIPEALVALKTLKQEFSLHVVRASQFPQSHEEQALGVTDEYHHRIRAESMADLYRSCDVVVVPSWACEGFGLPALEALSCGVPTVLSAIPSLRALAQGSEWTRFFPERDMQGMQTALRGLLHDTQLRANLRSRGLEVAREFSFARVAERIEQALMSGGVT